MLRAFAEQALVHDRCIQGAAFGRAKQESNPDLPISNSPWWQDCLQFLSEQSKPGGNGLVALGPKQAWDDTRTASVARAVSDIFQDGETWLNWLDAGARPC